MQKITTAGSQLKGTSAEGAGLTMSRLVYGVWRLGDDPLGASPQQVARKIELCLELGITTFDHADIYGDYRCESLFGAGLAALPPSTRERLQLVSKCGIKLRSSARPEHAVKHYDTSKEHIIQSAEASLRNLGTEALDLLLIHRPDPLMDADEVADAFTTLRASGKVRHFGVSNFTPAQVELLAARLSFSLVSNQIEFGPLAASALTDGTLDQCQQLRMLPMAWSPLAGGRLLTGSGAREQAVRQALADVGGELGAGSLEQVALAWIWRHPARVCAIIGTNQEARIRDAASALKLSLSRQQWHHIWSASLGSEVP